jgi:hypothetical protein
MSGWPLVLLGFVVGSLAVIAIGVLFFDVKRGAVGGGRATLARARRFLVVCSDPATETEAERWAAARRREAPGAECIVLRGPSDDEDALFYMVEEAVERERPDAIVVVRRAAAHSRALAGAYGRIKEEIDLPVDSINVPEGAQA